MWVPVSNASPWIQVSMDEPMERQEDDLYLSLGHFNSSPATKIVVLSQSKNQQVLRLIFHVPRLNGTFPRPEILKDIIIC